MHGHFVALGLFVVVAAAASSNVGGRLDQEKWKLIDEKGVEHEVAGTRLHFAAAYNQEALVLRLLASGAESAAARDSENGATPLHAAAWFGATRALIALLYDVASVETTTPTSGTQPTRPTLAPGADALLEMRDHAGQTALHYAARSGKRDAVRQLLMAGAQARALSRRGETPLYLAAAAGHASTCAMLARAAPDTLELALPAPLGATPLMAAAAGGHVAAVDVLLEAGACATCSITASEEKQGPLGVRSFETTWTPLHAAAQSGAVGAIDALLEAGADPRTQNAQGMTALHSAVAANQQQAYGALLRSPQGAAASKLRDSEGHTPLELAAHLGYTVLERDVSK